MTTWGRILGPNDDSTIPGTVICVEVGTYAEVDRLNPNRREHRLRCGFAISGRLENGKWTREKSLHFVASSSLWEWVNCRRQSGKPTWMFSSKLSALLTLAGFWTGMDSSEWSLYLRPKSETSSIVSPRVRRQLSRVIPGLLVEADPPTVVIAFNKGGWKIVGLDLRNYFDRPLTALAADCALPLATPPDRLARNEEWRNYCEQAARVTQQCVTRLCLWHRQNQMGHFGLTIAGMALAAYKHKWRYPRIELPPSQDDRDFERLAYYGGRTEPLWMGEVAYGRYRAPRGAVNDATLLDPPPRGPFHLVDARSFYGAVMAFQSVPVRCLGEGDGWPDPMTGPTLHDADVLAHVRIKSDRHEFPIRLPDRTVYATGDFWTHLCGPELQRALDAGCVADFGHWRWYDLQLAFREYALALWEQREVAVKGNDPLLAGVCKALLARLHGKFGQRNHRWQVCPHAEPPGPWRRWHVVDAGTGTTEHYRSIGWSVQCQTDGGDAAHCFPALAAWVTAWGREYLRSWVKIAGNRNCLYVSTDSMIVTDEGRVNLDRAGIIGHHGIGSCRVVETSESVRVAGTNHFKLGNRVCFAGIAAGCITDSGGTATYARFPTLRSTLAIRPVESLTEIKTVATIGPREETARVGPGGWLARIVLTQEASQWQKMPPEFPTLQGCE